MLLLVPRSTPTTLFLVKGLGDELQSLVSFSRISSVEQDERQRSACYLDDCRKGTSNEASFCPTYKSQSLLENLVSGVTLLTSCQEMFRQSQKAESARDYCKALYYLSQVQMQLWEELGKPPLHFENRDNPSWWARIVLDQELLRESV